MLDLSGEGSATTENGRVESEEYQRSNRIASEATGSSQRILKTTSNFRTANYNNRTRYKIIA